MDSPPNWRDRSRPTTNTEPSWHNSRSDSLTEELGAVGGQQVVRHEHHHHHHHHIHYIQDPPSSPAPNRRAQVDHRRPPRPDFQFSDSPAPPSYEEVVFGIPAAPSAASGAIPRTRNYRAPVPEAQIINPNAVSPDGYARSPISSCSSDSVISRHSFRPPLRSSSIPRRRNSVSTQSEDVLQDTFSSSPSPTVSVLSLESDWSDESAPREPSSLRDARSGARLLLLETVHNLQNRRWDTIDDAWHALVRKLFGRSRSANRDAEVAWEFAFRAPPLSHFGKVFRDISGVRAEFAENL